MPLTSVFKFINWITGTPTPIEDGVASAFTLTLQQSIIDAMNQAPFLPSGPNHRAGFVPDPGAVAGTTKFLCEDATFKVPGSSVSGATIGYVNKFRNGTLDIWQRGTSSLSVTSTYAYKADGWMMQSNGANSTASRQTGRSLTEYCARITGAASVTTVNFKQRIESYVACPLIAGNITVQLWIYNNTGSSFTPTLTVNYPTAQDNYAGTTTLVNAVSLASCPDAAWTQLGYTFATSTSIANGLEVEINIPSGQLANSARYIQFAELDIRSDPAASVGQVTTFNTPELRPIGPELDFCQRYYYRRSSSSSTDVLCMHQAFRTDASFGPFIMLPVTMRATPTCSVSANSDINCLTAAGGGPLAGTNFDTSGSSRNLIGAYNGQSWTPASLAAGNATIVIFANSSAWMDATAEL